MKKKAGTIKRDATQKNGYSLSFRIRISISFYQIKAKEASFILISEDVNSDM